MIRGKKKPILKLIPNEIDWVHARSVHTCYAKKSGSQHIATEFALAYLSALVRIIRPKYVLEIGAGIGTISQLLLDHPNKITRLAAIEGNCFCIETLKTRFATAFKERFNLITDPTKIEIGEQYFDLIVIDGLFESKLCDLLKKGSFCFVEGSRKSTRKVIIDKLENRNLAINFVNYNQGIRYFEWSTKYSDGRKRILPKFRFCRILKGCWIGQVTPLTMP
ncbi:MAG TPA: hypothetical protein DGR97_10865 [Gammaproteobacteria bacterium]|nr:hypothetical protein [Gammaproteobacteria bacterium]